MKKKIIISSLSFLVFTTVLILNLSLSNNKSKLKDFSLEQIFEMNLAQGESSGRVICTKNWQTCTEEDGTVYPDALVCDGGGGC